MPSDLYKAERHRVVGSPDRSGVARLGRHAFVMPSTGSSWTYVALNAFLMDALVELTSPARDWSRELGTVLIVQTPYAYGSEPAGLGWFVRHYPDEDVEAFRPDTDQPRPWTLLAESFRARMRPTPREEVTLQFDPDDYPVV